MNITKHNPDCPLAVWQLQMKIENDRMKYRAQCINCGAISPVTDTEAKFWNFTSGVIEVGIPEITE